MNNPEEDELARIKKMTSEQEFVGEFNDKDVLEEDGPDEPEEESEEETPSSEDESDTSEDELRVGYVAAGSGPRRAMQGPAPKKTPERAKRDRDNMTLKIAAVIPVHQIDANASRGKGRPKSIMTGPQPSALAYHAEMQYKKQEFIDNDPIVRAAEGRVSQSDMLIQVRHKFARLQAGLEFRTIEDEKYGGQMAAQIMSRQAAVLRDIAQTELKIKELGVVAIDFQGETMQKIFKLFIQKVQATAKETLEPAQMDLFFNRLETAFKNWEADAESVVR